MTLGSSYQCHDPQLHVPEQGNCSMSAENLRLRVFPEKVACPIGHAIGAEPLQVLQAISCQQPLEDYKTQGFTDSAVKPLVGSSYT